MMSAYLRLLTPTNLTEERTRFFSSPNYHPQLEYDWSRETIAACLAENPTIHGLVEALQSQHPATILQVSADFFDVKFRAQDVALAATTIKALPKPVNATPQDVVQALQTALAYLQADYTVLLLDQPGFQCRPNHHDKTISVSKYGNFQFSSVESLVKHELIHVIRAVNGNANGIAPETNYLPTEEGLACLMQDRYTATGAGSLFQHSLEYYASYLSQEHNFQDIYDFLLKCGCSPDVAWQRGIRQKYGLRDTTQPGGILKSAMYLYHEQLLGELDDASLLRLFVGKISQLSLERYPKYEGIIPENVIRQFCGLSIF